MVSNSPIHHVSYNLRRAREERGLSLSELARAAGISKSTLSDLERGRGNPSIDTLWALARALTVAFSTLFDDREQREMHVLRREDAPVVAVEGTGFVSRHLMTRDRQGEVELFLIELSESGERDAAPHSNGLIEHVVVLSGEVEVGPEGQTERLSAGDYARFPADRPHVYRALGGPARVLTVHDYS